VDDVVSIEHRPCDIPGDRHEGFVSPAGANQVSRCCASEIVKDASHIAHIAGARLALLTFRRKLSAISAL